MDKQLYDLTNPQKSIWLTEQYYRNTNINNVCGVYITSVSLNYDILEKAIKLFIKNNESYQTKLTLVDGKVKQYFDDYKDFNIEIVPVNSEKELLDLEEKENANGFELLDSNLFKITIFKFPDGHGGFIVNTSHIIADSWTSGIFANELSKIYDELIKGNDCSINKKFTYKEYIETENLYKNSEKFKKDKAYWDNIFTEVPEIASIPSTKKALNANLSHKANRLLRNIDSKYLKKLKEYCTNNKISLYNLFMSVYALYLGRVSNLDNFVIGTPILNRTNVKEKQTTGMFINVLPLKFNLIYNESFTNFISEVFANSTSLLRHQRYSYNYILEDLRKKDPTIPGLYDVLFSYQITKMNETNDALPHRTMWTFNNAILNSLEIHIFEWNDADTLQIAYDYKNQKYNENEIADLHERILYILDQIINNETILLKDIEIITEKESRTLEEFNNTIVKYPKEKTIIDLFEKQVLKTPNETAIVFENQKLTYKELNEKANSLAYHLRNTIHIKQNDLVGIMVNRSMEMIISIIATLKAGGAYIPIDPTYPEDRIQYMLKSSDAKVLLTQESLENKTDFTNKVLVDLNQDIYNFSCDNLEKINTPDDLAYVIFTSGSTGLPKGVMLKHKSLSNLTNYCNNYIEYLKNPSHQAIVSITTVSFDIFIFETLISLQRGLKLVIANEKEQTNPKLLNTLLEKHNITIIQSTPSRMQLFINNIKDIPSIKNLQYITLAGEQLPLSLVTTLKSLTNGIIYNGYGPSETTVFSTLTKMDNDFITIGKPLDNTQIYILDNNLKQLPIGIAGELYISGDGVGKGYLNNKDLTNRSFIENPYIPNSIMYKTGDMGMYNPDGSIVCLGRADNQVKIRGLRIELEEIEDKIKELSCIQSCVVAKRVNSEFHELLCAYFTSNTNVDPAVIRNHIEKFLPTYMIPQYFIQMSSLPYTPNGKVDRKKLPEPQIITSKREVVLPRNDVDSKLIEILKTLFNIDAISIDDSFFELGGDSLYAINLSIQIQDKFHVSVFSKDILENPIIKNLSDLIMTKSSLPEQKTIEKVPEAEFYNISSAQKRIYFASKLAGNSSVLYNIPAGIIVDGDIDAKRLENCFNTLINRHESLRTYFTIHDENVVQQIANNINFSLQIENNVNFDNLQKVFKEFVKPFDLETAPLFRAKLLKCKNGKSAILVDMHHIIADGASLSILLNELSKLYNGEVLEDLTITYKDFAEFENDQYKTSFFEEAENYWVHQFEGEIPVLNLPYTYSRPVIQSFEGKKVYASISLETKQKIDKLAKKLDITPYMILLSIYYILLAKYTSGEDIIVGSPIVGRDILETENLIGMFVNTLALRSHVDNQLSFKEFVLRIKDNILNAYTYQTYPFDELVNKLNIKRDTSRNPLFDTMFIYQNNHYNSINLNGANTTYYIPDAEISKFDLSLEALPLDDEIKLSFEYATKLFSEEFIENLSKHYLQILNVILENIDIKIENICMLSSEEQDKILNSFNDTQIDYDKNKTIAQLFEEQVEKTPDNIAVVFGNETLTFKELNEKANSLAYYLRTQGVTRNSLVGIMVERSLEVIVSMFATIKAGGAYIPIDPTYPKDRIDYMLESSNATILLTKKHLENKIEYKNKISIDLDNETIYNLPNKNLEAINEPEDLIYCIFTSGSTGKPKGVMIPHRVITNFTNYCNDYVEYLNKSNNDTIVSITTISFDLFVYEALISLQKGIKLVISNENEQTTPQLLNDLIEKNNATIIQSTPSIMQIFLNNIDNMPSLKKLKYVILAGEQLPLKLVQTLHELNITVYNGYGPSETHYCTLTKMNDEIITIGKPIYNSQMYILDKKLNPVPIGITGDIYISGDCVGKGYLNNKELTDKSFIPNPFIPKTLMYKSGDLGKYLDDGNILCLGRSDHQIKIRGLRIELEEIESLILKYPNINKVTVVKQTVQNREFISAYFVANKRIGINDLRKYLSHSLPRYMIPSYYIALDDLPYTPNGKIDKKALPLPNEIFNVSQEEYVAPKTKLEKQLVSLFEKILNTKPIGVNDNFFELGGDSLLAMNLNVELQKISNKVAYQDIFRFPTVNELTQIIESNDKKSMFKKVQNLSDNFTEILEHTQKIERIKKWYPKNILLTGSTGFLGIHILDELLKYKDTKIYCIVRDEPGLTSTAKLHQKLNYYFGDKYDNLINNRIFVITGNISKPGFGLDQEELLNLADAIDVVINSAANVAHYGNYNDFYNANVISVKYIIDFCNSFKKKLYHISTMGVAGRTLDSSFPKPDKKHKVIFDESSLYIGQDPENIYTYTKFEAEVQVLNAISNGLDAYILRMGNLMPRYKDGFFQENLADNAFLNRLASFVKIGIIPEYMLHNELEFTSVDYAAKAVCKILTHETVINRVFHICNHKTISVSRCLRVLRKLGYPIEVLPEKEFIEKVEEILKDEEKKDLLKIIIDDFDENMHINYNTDMKIKSKFTVRYLRRTIFWWSRLDNGYLTRFVDILRRLL